MLLRAHFCNSIVSGSRVIADQRNAIRSSSISNMISSSSSSSTSFDLSIRLNTRNKRCCNPKSFLINCKSFSPGSFDHGSSSGDDDDRDYLEASLMVSETVSHYRMQRHGIQEEMRWRSSGFLLPYSVQSREAKADVTAIGLTFLSRFQEPTVFLKISCDGDFLLPVIVGEFAIEKLIDALRGDHNGDSPDQFQFLSNLVEKIGYEVKEVRLTERGLNSYYAKMYFGKPGNNDILSVDAQPSDAINVASRCKAPIYVNKQIVLADAIRISYGMGRVRSTKTIFDVTLDSATEGPDMLNEELNLMRIMSLAVKEERYHDAAMLRDELKKLLESTQGH